MDILHDVGRSINPAIDIGQIEGGFIQGMGWLTTEEIVYDQEGRLLTHAPSTYKIPVASDVPADFRVALFSGSNREDTVYRSKAVGEPPLMLAISVFAAIADAIHSLDPAQARRARRAGDAGGHPEGDRSARRGVGPRAAPGNRLTSACNGKCLASRPAGNRAAGFRRPGERGRRCRFGTARGRRAHGRAARRRIFRHHRRRAPRI